LVKRAVNFSPLEGYSLQGISSMIYQEALAALNAHGGDGKPIEAADCVVIEDSKEGIRGARRAGMKCLAVTNSHPAELLADADAVVKSLEDVKLNFLQNMCS
jgi:beta-phosphoglucomutase-like phosphatase (HAD superfamily)